MLILLATVTSIMPCGGGGGGGSGGGGGGGGGGRGGSGGGERGGGGGGGGLFTRYDFLACDKLTTGLRHDLRPFTHARHFHFQHAKNRVQFHSGGLGIATNKMADV